jgi:hypothetical protein
MVILGAQAHILGVPPNTTLLEPFLVLRPLFLLAIGGGNAAFHFNSLTRDMFLPDPEGEELPNLDAARDVAELSAREAITMGMLEGQYSNPSL